MCEQLFQEFVVDQSPFFDEIANVRVEDLVGFYQGFLEARKQPLFFLSLCLSDTAISGEPPAADSVAGAAFAGSSPAGEGVSGETDSAAGDWPASASSVASDFFLLNGFQNAILI